MKPSCSTSIFMVSTAKYLNQPSSKRQLLDCVTVTNLTLSFSLDLTLAYLSLFEQLSVCVEQQATKATDLHWSLNSSRHLQESWYSVFLASQKPLARGASTQVAHTNPSVICKLTLEWLLCSNPALQRRKKALRDRENVTAN